MTFPLLLRESAGEKGLHGYRDREPVSGIEPLTCRLQDGCSAN